MQGIYFPAFGSEDGHESCFDQKKGSRSDSVLVLIIGPKRLGMILVFLWCFCYGKNVPRLGPG
jgi:hypothetical protein